LTDSTKPDMRCRNVIEFLTDYLSGAVPTAAQAIHAVCGTRRWC
jgi:hypothetical protein